LVILKNVTYNEAANILIGCFNYDAADDFDLCRPCRGNIHQDDIAGMGDACTNHQPNGGHGVSALRDPSCIASGRVDNCCQGYRESNGCQWQEGVTSGVMCCANNADNPCFYSSCPQDCCGNGLCDVSSGKCICLPGFNGEDCCTHCPSLDCPTCLNRTECRFCANTQSCVANDSATCFDFGVNCPVIFFGSSSDEVNGVPIGAIIGASLGGLLLTLCLAGLILGILLFLKFGRGEYAEMWGDILFSATNESPIYEGTADNVSPLYEKN
jgi:hypothetical protein